ncbi:hypothetical protein NESM_000371700 [Novymonas esmeraldas]|uniref:Peptidase C51 domain-containing protein n=1 Tax=Novymonas esmeraldas TaxID=1808958 RepID=A0AAW0ELK3_9TRYP
MLSLTRLVQLCALAALLCLGALYYFSVYDYEKHMSLVERRNPSYDPLTECATPFGELLGIADNVPAYSNCNTKFITTFVNFVNLVDPMDNGRRGDPSESEIVMTAYRYSSFDYHMRWLAWNRGLMPRLVENTNQLWKTVNFFNPARIEQDWSAEYLGNYEEAANAEERIFNAPRRADAIIYSVSPDTLPQGHVAVVVRVEDDVEAAGGAAPLLELKKQRLHPRRVYVAEQNWRNTPWLNRNYSRVLHYRWRTVAGGRAHEGYLIDPDGLEIIGILRVGKAMPLRSAADPYADALAKDDDERDL